MASAYESIASGDFTGPLPRLKTPLRGESPLMAAERNYLAALCCIELQTAAGIDEGASVLTSWEPSLRGEHEMRLRFLLLLQQAQVLAEMFDNARETERAIERKLLARSRYDHDAAMMLQVQNRRAAALNSPEVAELRIREAVAFSRRGPEGSGTDRLELFRSLNNLAAILIRLGRYADAYAAAREAERVVLDAPDAMARLDVLASNVVLAGLRSGVLPLPDAIARQELIIESPEGGDDKFIHRCNLCAYLLLAARDDEALEELALLREELRRNEFVESYLVYYLRSLEVTAAALHGDLDRASGLHAQMTPFVDALMWPCAPYVRRRQNLLASVLGRIQLSSDRASADTALLALRPSEIGPAWNYYARLLPCCELSFWSDS